MRQETWEQQVDSCNEIHDGLISMFRRRQSCSGIIAISASCSWGSRATIREEGLVSRGSTSRMKKRLTRHSSQNHLPSGILLSPTQGRWNWRGTNRRSGSQYRVSRHGLRRSREKVEKPPHPFVLAVWRIARDHLAEADALTETVERLVGVVVSFERFELVVDRNHLSRRRRLVHRRRSLSTRRFRRRRNLSWERSGSEVGRVVDPEQAVRENEVSFRPRFAPTLPSSPIEVQAKIQ